MNDRNVYLAGWAHIYYLCKEIFNSDEEIITRLETELKDEFAKSYYKDQYCFYEQAVNEGLKQVKEKGRKQVKYPQDIPVKNF